MTNGIKGYFKKDPSLNHTIKCSDDLNWSISCSVESTTIAEQIYKGADADFWSNVLATIGIVCFLGSIYLFDFWTWGNLMVIAFSIWTIVYKIKVRLTKVVNITYEMRESANEASVMMVSPFSDIASCEKIIEVTGSESFSDTNHIKNNGGSDCELSQRSASATLKLPFPICSNRKGAVLDAGGAKILALSECAYVLSSDKCTPVPYLQFTWNVSSRIIIEENPPSDAEIAEETWQHVNMNGEPDKRFSENKKLWKCRYGQISISCGDVFNVVLLISNINVARKIYDFVKSINKR